MSNGNGKTTKKLSKKTMQHINKQGGSQKWLFDWVTEYNKPGHSHTSETNKKKKPKKKISLKKGGKIKRSNYNGWDIQPT